MFDFLSGYKTYILCAVAALVALAELAGVDVVPGVDRGNAISWLWEGAVGATVRAAIGKV